jgi:hypothetical protein
MEADSQVCLEHTVLVHSAVQVLLNTFLYILLPLQQSLSWLYIFILPVCVCNCLLGTASVLRNSAQLLTFYVLSLGLTLVYRTALILQLLANDRQIQQVLQVCDQLHSKRSLRHDLPTMSPGLPASNWNDICDQFDLIRVQQFDGKSALGFIGMSTFGEAILLAISIQLLCSWRSQSTESQLVTLHVRYDPSDPRQVFSKSLVNKYGTFEVLEEDGSLDSDVRFLRQPYPACEAIARSATSTTTVSVELSDHSIYQDATDRWLYSSCRSTNSYFVND